MNNGSMTLVREDIFRKLLSLERKRSERSRQRFVLMLVEPRQLLQGARREAMLRALTKAVHISTRETDMPGWYVEDRVIGVIWTEIGSGSITSIRNALRSRVLSALRNDLSPEEMNDVHISFHVYPEDLDLGNDSGSADISLYADLRPRDKATILSLVIKRAIDIVGATLALLLFSPALVVIAAVIKLTSKGPILFKQQRLGQYGVRFTFLKFRSMHHKNDATIHRAYVRQLISANGENRHSGDAPAVYKIKNDPRVTPFGRFLRKSSLDEVPQFINVLKGEMSLVGPRPPIPYEVENYDFWHRRRFLEVKPGITGLWQVEGRSRVEFDDMVRLDIKYARTWSPWLDIKILLRTPGALLRGAY